MVLLTDGSKDDFRDILRGAFTIEAMISVDSRRKVWNGIRWQVSTEVESMIPTSISINPRDCKRPPVDRESEFIPPSPGVNDPWVDYHVGMFKWYIDTVGKAAWNVYDYHGYRYNGWLHPDRKVVLGANSFLCEMLGVCV